MDTRRLTAPLVAAGLLRRRPAAPAPDAVREALADARERPIRVETAEGAQELVLRLPAGAGPHPVLIMAVAAADGTAARLPAHGVATLRLPAGAGAATVAAVARALAERIDVNPHEIGLAGVGAAPAVAPPEPFGFVVDGAAADLLEVVLSRVTILT